MSSVQHDMRFNKVSMIGLGYIGLPTAAIMASRGLEGTMFRMTAFSPGDSLADMLFEALISYFFLNKRY